ncbi:hypothetical protein [Symbiobacterium terraclitae]|uniref:hypothetical protein n=1 Tax=Symbiobacterium terraclitae TaxID=557451 RepID=UPI0035B523FF
MSSLMRADGQASVLEQVVIQGDLSKLRPEDRVAYYKAVCESVGLNPLTKPFDYIVLNGKLTLYARRDAAEQLRKIHGISVTKLECDYRGDLYVVTAYGQDKAGRVDAATGAVSIAGLKGEQLANALMKAETKAKRRLTLSLAGLGWLDETETDSIPGAVKPPTVDVDGVIDARPIPEDKSPEPMCTKADYETLVQTATENGWREEDVKAYLKSRGYSSIRQVPASAMGEALEHFSRPVEAAHEEATDDAPHDAGTAQATLPLGDEAAATA